MVDRCAARRPMAREIRRSFPRFDAPRLLDGRGNGRCSCRGPVSSRFARSALDALSSWRRFRPRPNTERDKVFGRVSQTPARALSREQLVHHKQRGIADLCYPDAVRQRFCLRPLSRHGRRRGRFGDWLTSVDEAQRLLRGVVAAAKTLPGCGRAWMSTREDAIPNCTAHCTVGQAASSRPDEPDSSRHRPFPIRRIDRDERTPHHAYSVRGCPSLSTHRAACAQRRSVRGCGN